MSGSGPGVFCPWSTRPLSPDDCCGIVAGNGLLVVGALSSQGALPLSDTPPHALLSGHGPPVSSIPTRVHPHQQFWHRDHHWHLHKKNTFHPHGNNIKQLVCSMTKGHWYHERWSSIVWNLLAKLLCKWRSSRLWNHGPLVTLANLILDASLYLPADIQHEICSNFPMDFQAVSSGFPD